MAAIDVLTFDSANVAVTVLPDFGARLHSLRAYGHELLRTPADPREHARDPFFWGAFVMAPWCNRVDSGSVEVSGRRVDLPVNFADGSAIHGQTYDAPWHVDGQGQFSVRGGGAGWPWEYSTSLRVEVTDDEVRLEQTLTNLSDGLMPGGIGMHPWFTGRVKLAIHSAQVYASNTASSPEPIGVSGSLDLRHPTEMEVGVDATWPQVADPAVDMWWADASIHATLRVNTATPHIVAANPGNRGAIAVEPETNAPQGLRRLLAGSPGGLQLLESGEVLSLTSVLRFERSA